MVTVTEPVNLGTQGSVLRATKCSLEIRRRFPGGGRRSMEKRIIMTFSDLGIRNGGGEFWKLGISWTETRARDC